MDYNQLASYRLPRDAKEQMCTKIDGDLLFTPDVWNEGFVIMQALSSLP